MKMNPAAPEKMNEIMQPNAALDHAPEMIPASDEASIAQAAICKLCADVLRQMEQGCGGLHAYRAYGEAVKTLRSLGNFSFNVGFAGEQSCGKSTVINSLIAYPLMPTCRLTTTATVVSLVYGRNVRITATDDRTGKCVLDVDCASLSEARFQALKEYACLVERVATLENLQAFTDVDVKNVFYTPDTLDMHRTDPRHVATLLLVLLCMYVEQNAQEEVQTQHVRAAISKRREVLQLMNMPLDVINYKVQVTWPNELLRSGLRITDLPGLGANVEAKSVGSEVQKDHETITHEALKDTDFTVFIGTPTLHKAGMEAVDATISNAALKAASIMPMLNQADTLGENELQNTLVKFASDLTASGMKVTPDMIRPYSAIYGEYDYEGIPFTRTLFFQRQKAMMSAEFLPMFQMMLEKQYQKSGIAQLRQFILTEMVQHGKHQLAATLIHYVKMLCASVSSDCKAKLQILINIGNMGREILDKITTELNDHVQGAINTSMTEISKAVAAMEQECAQTKALLDAIPELYEMQFNAALDDYKARVTAQMDKFDLALGGLGFSACVSQGSNVAVYNALIKEMGRFHIDIIPINERYSLVMDEIQRSMKALFVLTRQEIVRFQELFPQQLEAYTSTYAHSAYSGPALALVNQMKDTMAEYIEAQIEGMLNLTRIRENELRLYRNKIAGRIQQINASFISIYKKRIGRLMALVKRKGVFDETRQLLRINDDLAGNVGLRSIIANLKLSENDQQTIQDSLNTTANESIKQEMNTWTMEADIAAKDMFTGLSRQVDAMFDDLKKAFDASERERLAQIAELRRRIEVVENASRAQTEGVQRVLEGITSEKHKALYTAAPGE